LGRIHQIHVTFTDALKFGGNVGLALFQLGDASLGIGRGSLDHLSQQFEHRNQARFGADKLALAQTQKPRQCLLSCRCQVEMRLVAVGWVVLAQPAAIFGRPVVEILARTARKGAVAQPLTQMEEVVVQLGDELLSRDGAQIGLDEAAVKEASHKRRVVRHQQPPSWVFLAKSVERLEIHSASPLSSRSIYCVTGASTPLTSSLSLVVSSPSRTMTS
jgi:hypothetical protein